MTERRDRRVLLTLLVLLALLAAVVAALALGSRPAESAFPGANGKIAFESSRDGNFEIYVMNADGSNQTRLTNNPARDTEPRWSPDGTTIAFVTDRDGNPEIYVMDADGSNEINLTNNPGLFDLGPSWQPLPITVPIDIKPGSDPNSVNLGSRGMIPVAVLTTPTFDATTVDADTVQFGPGAATKLHKKAHVEDVDGDGDLDLVLHFRSQDTGIASTDTEACLTGETFDGQEIVGCDSVNVVP